MDCSILGFSHDANVRKVSLLCGKDQSLDNISLSESSEEKSNQKQPASHELLPDNAVLVQTDEGLLLSMPEGISEITYQSLASSDLNESQSFSILENQQTTKTSFVHPPETSDFDTGALDKFPELGATLSLDGISNDVNTRFALALDVLQDKEVLSSDKDAKLFCFNLQHTVELPAQTEVPSPKKGRGGWPKGKKRKLDTGAPHIPRTAFVIFSQERRAQIKQTNPECSFTEMTRMLSSEWSAMKRHEKQMYVERSLADRQRYMAEMKVFQEANNINISKSNKPVGDNGDAPSEIDNSDGDVLYCSVCDQHFSSYHNKREHFYGSKHTQVIAEQKQKAMLDYESTHCTCTCTSCGKTEGKHKKNDTVDMQEFTTTFYEKNMERDWEINLLQNVHKIAKGKKAENFRKIEEHKKEMDRLQEAIHNMKSNTNSLVSNINSLKLVPTLFGVINL